MTSIHVVDYDPAWPVTFETIRARVWPALAEVAIAMEHVGSTAVPGLAAKPVIDLDVIVPDDRVAPGIERLASLGYAHRGDLGIPGREAFTSPATLPKHHLYLCQSSSPALANHRTIRDHLRRHPEAMAAYGALKRQLAARHPDDIDAYVEGKTTFLTAILRGAGMSDAHLDEIERMNRKR